MNRVKEKYITDEQGHKTGVIVPLPEYKKMMEHLEDAEDALELEKARKEDTEFETLDEFVKTLKKKKKK